MERVLRGTLALYVANFVTQIVAFLVNVYVARTKGVDIFGQFVFATTYASFFAVLADPGITELAKRELAKSTVPGLQYASTISVIRLAIAIVAFVILASMAVFTFSGLELALVLTYGLAFLIAPALSLSWVFFGKEKISHAAVAAIVLSVSNLAFIVVFSQFSASLIVFPAAQLAANMVAVLLLFYLFVREFGPLDQPSLAKFNWQEFAKLLWPFALSGVIIASYFRIGTFILRMYGEDGEIGIYGAAFKLTFLLQTVTGLYFGALYPTLSRLSTSAKNTFAVIADTSIDIWVVLILPLVIGGTLIADPLIAWLYSSQFQEAVIPFQILLWAVLATSISGTYSNILLAQNQQVNYFKAVGISFVFSSIVSLIAIPSLGATGAAIGYTTAEFVSLGLVQMYSRSFVSAKLLPKFIKPLIASLVMGCVVMGVLNLYAPWWLAVAVGVPIYLITLILIKGVSQNLFDLSKWAIMSFTRWK